MEWTGRKSSVTVVTQSWIVTEIYFWYQSSDLSCNWISLEYDEIFSLILLIFPFPIFEYSIFFSQECQIKSDLLRIDGYTWLGLDSTGQSTGRANIKSPFRSKTFASFDLHAPQSYVYITSIINAQMNLVLLLYCFFAILSYFWGFFFHICLCKTSTKLWLLKMISFELMHTYNTLNVLQIVKLGCSQER